MDIRFLPHNSHLEAPGEFSKFDPQLRRLRSLPLVHRSAMIDEIPVETPGVYTITGGRQIGKTTLVKQWMEHLLNRGVMPSAIRYMTGELLDDRHSLVRTATEALSEMPDASTLYLAMDEITYVKDWEKGVKFLVDAGLLDRVVLVLTGSDTSILKEMRILLPGRRGKAEKHDFHMYPLSFREYVELKDHDLIARIEKAEPVAEKDMTELFEKFENYLIHGGFLTAINDFASDGNIAPSTLATYSDWIRGDVIKRNRRENYLREILDAVLKRHGSQATYNALAKDLSIDHPKTVSDYIELLVSMDAVYICAALNENKLEASPKKAKKIMFGDPFIFHAVHAWLKPSLNPYEERLLPVVSDPKKAGSLVESTVITHYRRYFSSYYIKAEGEVDLAYVEKGRFYPVEIKWTGQLRPKNLKQVAKYENSKILTRRKAPGEINGIPTEPLPLALLKLDIAAQSMPGYS